MEVLLTKLAEYGLIPLSLGVIVYVIWSWQKCVSELNKTFQNHLAHDQELYERTLDVIERNSENIEKCHLINNK